MMRDMGETGLGRHTDIETIMIDGIKRGGTNAVMMMSDATDIMMMDGRMKS